jgi:Family of unknown function (DUF6544)
MKIVLGLVLVVVVGLVVTQLVVSSRFADRIAGLESQLANDQLTSAPTVGALPEIVRAFATKAGAREGGPYIVRLTQSVAMRFAPDQPWQELTATHLAGTRASGFVWHATGNMMYLPIGVVDAFVKGTGLLNARLLNTISVANSQGSATDRGELLRYLAEIPLTPDVILNNSKLVWNQIDETTVSVTAPMNGGGVTVEFSFNEQGDIVEAFAAARPMGIGDKWVDTPWRGRFFDYKQLGPRRIPTRAEVGWELLDDFYLYFRGVIDSYALQ